MLSQFNVAPKDYAAFLHKNPDIKVGSHTPADVPVATW